MRDEVVNLFAEVGHDFLTPYERPKASWHGCLGMEFARVRLEIWSSRQVVWPLVATAPTLGGAWHALMYVAHPCVEDVDSDEEDRVGALEQGHDQA